MTDENKAVSTEEARPTAQLYMGQGSDETPTPVQGNYWVKYDVYRELREEKDKLEKERDEFRGIRDAVVQLTALGAGVSKDAVMESPVKFVRKLKERAEAAERQLSEAQEALRKIDVLLQRMSLACTLPQDDFQRATRKVADEAHGIAAAAMKDRN